MPGDTVEINQTTQLGLATQPDSSCLWLVAAAHQPPSRHTARLCVFTPALSNLPSWKAAWLSPLFLVYACFSQPVPAWPWTSIYAYAVAADAAAAAAAAAGFPISYS